MRGTLLELRSLLARAEGGAGTLHNITKPLPWSGWVQVIEDVSEEVQPLQTVEVKRHPEINIFSQLRNACS